MNKLPALAVAVTTLCFALVACSGSDPTPTNDPIATADVDATVRISVQQTTVANEAIESTVAAAVAATRTAEANQVTPTPTAMPVPTPSPVIVPTVTSAPTSTAVATVSPTTVSPGIEVTDFTCVVTYPGIQLPEGETIDLVASGKMTNRTGIGQLLTGITVVVFSEGNTEMARSEFEPQVSTFPQNEPLDFNTTIPEPLVRNATECEVYFDLKIGSQPTSGDPRVPVEFFYAP